MSDAPLAKRCARTAYWALPPIKRRECCRNKCSLSKVRRQRGPVVRSGRMAAREVDMSRNKTAVKSEGQHCNLARLIRSGIASLPASFVHKCR